MMMMIMMMRMMRMMMKMMMRMIMTMTMRMTRTRRRTKVKQCFENNPKTTSTHYTEKYFASPLALRSVGVPTVKMTYKKILVLICSHTYGSKSICCIESHDTHPRKCRKNEQMKENGDCFAKGIDLC